MPNNIINKVSDQCGLSKKRTEHLWEKAVSIAAEKGFKIKKGKDADNHAVYAYIMGVFKRMITTDCNQELHWKLPDTKTREATPLLKAKEKLGRFDTLVGSADFGLEQVNPNLIVDLAVERPSKDNPEVKVSLDGNDQARASVPIDATFWLPLAAPHYQISPHMEDYLLMPTPTLISDLPNTNGDSVSKEELLTFLPFLGMPAYKTFKGKPMFIEHQSKDPSKAIGIILEVLLRPLRGFADNHHAKMIELLAFDKTKDPDLCRKLENGEINTMSIGMTYGSYECSVCGTHVAPNQGHPCSHTYLRCKTYKDPYTQLLVYRRCHGIRGFETSVVKDPAYVSAIGTLLSRS